MKKKLSISLVVLGLSLLLGYTADAAQVLTGNIDLKGYDATITTKADGTNVLKTKKGEYDLNETSTIYSSKTITVTLNNTTPVTINKIQAKNTLELRGNGQLNVNTTEDVGITVGDHFKAFKHAKYGKGFVTTNASIIGLRVHNEIQMEGGSVEATGSEYGIYCENDIKPYYDSVLKGTSNDGIGIHAYRDIYAWKGATVVGEGKVSGARSIIAHIQAEDAGSSITGISTDITSSLSALHADKKMLRAYRGAIVHEEYRNPPFVITDNIPIFVTEYASVSRNMQYMSNYNWISEPESVYLNDQGGLLGDLSKGAPKEVTITATRTGEKCQKNKSEKTELKNNGQHIITFSNTATKFVRPVTINYWNYDPSVEGSYKLIEKKTIEMDIGSTFVVNDHLYNFDPAAEYDLLKVDTSDFEITKDSNEYTVNYYYDAEFN